MGVLPQVGSLRLLLVASGGFCRLVAEILLLVKIN